MQFSTSTVVAFLASISIVVAAPTPAQAATDVELPATASLTGNGECTYGQYRCAPGRVSILVCDWDEHWRFLASCGAGNHCETSNGNPYCQPGSP